jgi:hypothetical protein
VAGVVLIAAAGVALFVLFGRDDGETVAAPDRSSPETTADETTADETTADETTADETTADETTAQETTTAEEPTATEEPAGIPDPTVSPDGLGSDPALDVLALGCYAGDMQACDNLYDAADAGSDYQTYGDTCAGRQASGTLDYCTETFPRD